MKRWIVGLAMVVGTIASGRTTRGDMIVGWDTDQAAIERTGLVVVASNSTGNDPGFGGGIWTTSTQNWWKLWVSEGSPGGPFINGPDAAHAGISIPLTNGVHTFTLQSAGDYPSGVDTFAFNMFFNGQTAAPHISAYAPLQQGTSVPSFHVNNSPNTSGIEGESIPAAGTLTFAYGGATVTLTDFGWARPEVFLQDRISPLSTVPDGKYEFVGRFTIEVSGVSPSSPVPEPSTLAMFLGLGGMGLIGAWRRRRRAA